MVSRLLFILIILSTLSAKVVAQQDTLVFKDESRLVVKILEVNPSEVKYKEADNLEGPLFVAAKSDLILAVYSNGREEVFDERAHQKMLEKVIPEKSGNRDWYGRDYEANMKKYRSKKIPAIILTSVGGSFVLSSAVLFATAAEFRNEVSVPGMVLGGVGIPLVGIGGKLFSRAKFFKKRADKQKSSMSASLTPVVIPSQQFSSSSIIENQSVGIQLSFTF